MNENRYAQFYALPERFQTVVDAGIPLIELRRTRPYDNSQKIMGYWNVSVREYAEQGSFQINHSVRWFTNQQAYIEFYPNKKSICTAFAPDDDSWHNRVMIALHIDTGIFTVEKIHTPNGVIPAKAAMQEMQILRDLILEWKAFDGSDLVFRSRTRIGIDAFAKDFLQKNGRAVDIVLGKTENIERLIVAHGGRWMETAEFQTTTKVKALELISAEQANMPVSMAQIGQSVLTQVASMDEAHKRELAAMLFPYMSPASRLTGATDGAPATVTPSRESEEATIRAMTFADLKRLAKAKNVTPGTKNKEDLITALLDKLAEERSANAPAALPPEAPFTLDEAGNPYDGVETADEEVAQ